MIKEFRKRHNMSQQKLSELSGVSRSYIGELENKHNCYSKNKKASQLYRFMALYDSQKRSIEKYQEKPVIGKIIDFFAKLLGEKR